MTGMAEEPLTGFRLPKSAIRWVGAGLVVSSSVIIVISVISGVNLADLARIGYLPFGFAALVSSLKLIVQAVRFRLMVLGLSGHPSPDLSGSAIARTASEFVALSTPSMIGGEFVRAAWLSGKGVAGGKALWIGYFEVVVDVYASSALALISAAYAFSKGATVIASTILLVVLLLLVGYTVVFLIPAARGLPNIPPVLFHFAAYLIGEKRAKRLELVVQEGAQNFSLAARAILRKDALPLVLKVLGLTMIQALLSGLALSIVLTAAGLKIDLFSSILVAFGATALTALPISIGGSGITELAVQSYLSSIYGFSSWAAIVLWRIASYQILLAVTGVAFLLLIHRATRSAAIGSNDHDQRRSVQA